MRFLVPMLLPVVLAAQSSLGQIEGLATTYDGSVLYFSTQMRMKGSGQSPAYKIFAADSTGIRLAVDEEGGVPVDRRYPDISDDGQVLSHAARPSCAQCTGAPWTSVVRGRKDVLTITGRIQLSPDGDWAIVQPTSSAPERLNLTTKTRQTLSGIGIAIARYDFRRMIADNGTVLGNGTAGVTIVPSQGVPQRVTTRYYGTAGSISGDGNTVLYEIPLFDPMVGGPQQPPPGWRLVDLTSGEEVALGGIHPVLSHNGKRVLMLMPDPVRRQVAELWDRLSGRRIRLFDATAEAAALSGDGRIAYVLTEWGVYRIVADTGQIEPFILYPARVTPWSWGGGKIVPGSLQRVVARTRLMWEPEAPSAPLPLEWRGVRVLLNGEPAPLWSVGDRRLEYMYTASETLALIEFQTPWGLRASDGAVQVEVEMPRAPFEYASRFPESEMAHRFAARDPRFVTLEPREYYASIQFDFPALLALHEDGVTIIDGNHPARKGEVIDAYMTGLGPVDQEVRDGELPPGDPPARPVQSITCEGAETADAKLAQGLIGLYRVSLRLLRAPKTVPYTMLFCDGDIGNRMALPMIPEP